MPTEDFRLAAQELFLDGQVEVVEWSYDLPWQSHQNSAVIPDWCQQILATYSNDGLLLGHGVRLSPLSARRNEHQKRWLDMLKVESEQRKYKQLSEHFGFFQNQDFYDGAPLPLPFSRTALDCGRAMLQELSRILDTPIGLENLAFAFCQEDIIKQGQFLDQLLSEIDGYLVLDLHNIFCQSQNFGLEAEELLNSYPLERVTEIHVSGGSYSQASQCEERLIRRDTHDGPLPEKLFNLVASAIGLCENLQYVICERLGNTMPDEAERSQFRADYLKLKEVLGQAARRVSNHRGPRKVHLLYSPIEDEKSNLIAYQDKVLELLYGQPGQPGSEPSSIKKALIEDRELRPYGEYISGFDLDMISVAVELQKKWAKRNYR